jgi:hypothetical protein
MAAKVSGLPRIAGMGLGVPPAPTDGAVCTPLPHMGERDEGVI